MRHQGRNGHGAKDAPRRTSEYELAHAGMAVATHDEEIRGSVRGMGEDGAGDVDIPCRDSLDLDLDAVAGKMMRNLGARQLVALCRLPGNHHDLGRLGSPENGAGIA